MSNKVCSQVKLDRTFHFVVMIISLVASWIRPACFMCQNVVQSGTTCPKDESSRNEIATMISGNSSYTDRR